MLRDYLPIVVLFILALAFAIGTVIISYLVGTRKPTLEKITPYECGIEPRTPARVRLSIKFFLIAMLFIVFDIEAIFIFPWAVVFRELKLYGFIEMLIFILILAVSLAYAWKRGALEWD